MIRVTAHLYKWVLHPGIPIATSNSLSLTMPIEPGNYFIRNKGTGQSVGLVTNLEGPVVSLPSVVPQKVKNITFRTRLI
jgi:hypothetical protein